MARRNVNTTPVEEMTLTERIKAWKEKNPFRVWLREQRLSNNDAIAITRASHSTIINWFNGATRPNADYMIRIAGIMKVPMLELEQQWDRWMDQAPEA